MSQYKTKHINDFTKKELQEFMLDKIDVHRTKGKPKYIRCRKTKKYARQIYT